MECFAQKVNMTETTQQKEMKRYLFHEMPETERAALEERFFEDSDYFYELVGLENDLVDRYVSGRLSGKDLAGFEQSLAKSPERRTKIANARALQTLIAEEKPAPVLAPTLWERAANFFNFRMPALQYATGALAILLACATGFLLYQNWQASRDFARLENERSREIAEKADLQRQIEQIRQQQEALAKQLETRSEENEVIKAEFDKKQLELEELKRRLLEEKNNQSPKTGETAPLKPLLAAIFPTGRGEAAVKPVARVVIIGGKQRTKVTIPLPAGKDYGSYEITTANGEKKIDSGAIAEGAKSFVSYLPPENTEFEIKVSERAATRGSLESLGTFRLELRKRR